MFRQGGWAVPLRCDSPTLQAWLARLQWACGLLGGQCEPLACPSNWTPLTIMGTALAAVAGLLLALWLAAQSFARWLSSRRGSTMAAAASRAIAELRAANPRLYPPAPHCWYRLAGEQLRAPMLCAVCLDRFLPEHDRVHCCEVCGTVAHDGCVRKVPHDCRPVAEAGERMLHQWKPAGVVMYEPEDDIAESTTHVCLYCQSHCEADVFAQEPAWCCSWCRAAAHVRCYREFHEHAAEQAAAAGEGRGGGDGRAESGSQAGPPTLTLPDAGAAKAKKRDSALSRRNGRKHGRQRSVALADCAPNGSHVTDSPRAAAGGTARGLGAFLRGSDVGPLQPARRSISAFLNTLVAAVSGGMEEEELLPEPGSRGGPWRPGDVDLSALDTCSFGMHRRLVLPPTAVRLLPADSWSDRAKSFLRGSSKKKRRAGQTAAATPSSPQQQGTGGTQRAATWWGEARVPWGSYRIEGVPPGCKPLLVFLNTRSGPQAGGRLRRQLLRLLNPIQVVELPKEAPEAALQLFADVPNLQVLVMGGDGTAGWVLSCLDSIQEARAAGAEESHLWSPPPVAVLPLGTGNDLARCLNWGGGLGAWQRGGLASVLADVEHAIVALLDRWAVHIQPAADKERLPRPALPALGQGDGNAKAVTKAMNNYLGIGVDAKAALDFHALRDAYPGWFFSQMGNKLWYTTVGAKDIIGHTSRGLSRKLEVVCDGEVLPLPDDIEGLLLLNINSYMGGVDLWASGAQLPGYPAAGAQSFCDGRLELVAVYGSWHLGQLQVGLSRAIRLRQCSSVAIHAKEALPMQIDGEPWLQPPARLQVALRGKAFMLRRVESEPLSRMAQVVAEALDEMASKGVISAHQRRAITAEIAARLHPVL